MLRFILVLHGGLAQLARAFAWHAKGHRFDSDILHLFFFGSFRPFSKEVDVKKNSRLLLQQSTVSYLNYILYIRRSYGNC